MPRKEPAASAMICIVRLGRPSQRGSMLWVVMEGSVRVGSVLIAAQKPREISWGPDRKKASPLRTEAGIVNRIWPPAGSMVARGGRGKVSEAVGAQGCRVGAVGRGAFVVFHEVGSDVAVLDLCAGVDEGEGADFSGAQKSGGHDLA